MPVNMDDLVATSPRRPAGDNGTTVPPPDRPPPAPPKQPDPRDAWDKLNAEWFRVNLARRAKVPRSVRWASRVWMASEGFGQWFYFMAKRAREFALTVTGGHAPAKFRASRTSACDSCPHAVESGRINGRTFWAVLWPVAASVAGWLWLGIAGHYAALGAAVAVLAAAWLFAPSGRFCGQCGCWRWRPARTRNKVKFNHARCPLSLWPGEDAGCSGCKKGKETDG